ALHDFRTGEAAAFPAALADRPGEPRFDRRRSLVQIVAIHAEPGLKPQRIARTDPRGLHLILVEQLPREALGLVGRDRHLEAVLSRVAGPGYEGGNSADIHLRHAEKRHRPNVVANEARHDV